MFINLLALTTQITDLVKRPRYDLGQTAKVTNDPYPQNEYVFLEIEDNDVVVGDPCINDPSGNKAYALDGVAAGYYSQGKMVIAMGTIAQGNGGWFLKSGRILNVKKNVTAFLKGEIVVFESRSVGSNRRVNSVPILSLLGLTIKHQGYVHLSTYNSSTTVDIEVYDS